MTERARKTQTESMLLTRGQSFPECDTAGKEAGGQELQKRAAAGGLCSGAEMVSCTLVCHGIQRLLNSSGQGTSIPSFGEMRQKGSHTGSLVHRSQAELFLFIQRCSKSDFSKDKQPEMSTRPQSGLVWPGLPFH